jgi:hypothetical protein
MCQSEVNDYYIFCPNCGARLIPANSSVSLPLAENGAAYLHERRKLSRVGVATTVIALLVIVSVFIVIPLASHKQAVNHPTNCASSLPASTFVAAPIANYDVQEVMVFAETYAQLDFNVTAIAQCDASGYGPSYLLNGLSNSGYWYQVGIDWNWPLQTGGFNSGFGFLSEEWAPGGSTRSPSSISFSGVVNQGDIIELSLSFNEGRVVASAHDLDTGASGSTSYPARGATTFVGSQAQQSQARFSFGTEGYFTGLMTEWYHVSANYSGPERNVTYSQNTMTIESATLGVGEWNFTASVPASVFSVVAASGNPIDFGAQPNQLEQFVLNGFTLSADGHEFVTGP